MLHELLRLDLHAYAIDPLRGSTYIPLPDDLLAKQAVINIQNNDDKCFIWCVIAAMYGYGLNEQRVAQYREHEHKLNMSSIEMPMKCTKQNIAKFERQNDVSVSVYGWENSRFDEFENEIS